MMLIWQENAAKNVFLELKLYKMAKIKA